MALRRALKRLQRRLRDSVAVQSVVAHLFAGYLWLVFHTTRWRYANAERLEALWEARDEETGAPQGFVAAVWHARLFPIAMLRRRGRRAVALISPNRDGDLLARVMAATGADAIRASSRDPKKPQKDTGVQTASPLAIEALNEGAVLVITPDGPRGPRMRAKAGAAMFSAASGRPVLPVAYSVSWAVTLGTWDRFVIPLPFGRGVFVFGAPIPPTASNDRAVLLERTTEIEAAITAATREADRRMGRDTPQPGPALSSASDEAGEDPAEQAEDLAGRQAEDLAGRQAEDPTETGRARPVDDPDALVEAAAPPRPPSGVSA